MRLRMGGGMKPVVVGVISKKMCESRLQPKKTDQQLEAIFLTAPKFRAEQAVLVEGPQLSYVQCICPSSQSLREVLVNKVATTMADLDVIQTFPLPTGYTRSLMLPLEQNPVAVRVLPALIPSDPSLVSWSIYSHDYHQVYAFDGSMGYIDFLLHHCVKELGVAALVDYALFIHTKPLIFGQATVVFSGSAAPPKGYKFFFSRVLCSKEMVKLFAELQQGYASPIKRAA
jgi:hypothetical protein